MKNRANRTCKRDQAKALRRQQFEEKHLDEKQLDETLMYAKLALVLAQRRLRTSWEERGETDYQDQIAVLEIVEKALLDAESFEEKMHCSLGALGALRGAIELIERLEGSCELWESYEHLNALQIAALR